MARFLGLESYSIPARVFWIANVVVGGSLVCYSIWSIGTTPLPDLAPILVGLAIASLAGLFPVVIPNTKIAIAGGEIFIFLILLLFGVPAATVAAAGEAAVTSARSSKKWTSRIGGPAIAAVVMWSCGIFLRVALAEVARLGIPHFTGLFIALALFSVLYATASSLMLSTLVALVRRSGLNPTQWWSDYGWVGPVYAVSASISGMLFATAQTLGFTTIFVAVPIIGMFITTLHYFFRHKETRREAELTARHLADIRQSEERFHSAFSHSAIAMALVSTDFIALQVNKAFCDMLGYTSEALTSKDITACVAESDRERLTQDVSGLIDQTSTVKAEYLWHSRDGAEVCGSLHVGYFTDWPTAERCLIFQLQDVTAQRVAESRLRHVAYHDALTGLPNRNHFNDLLRDAIAAVKQGTVQKFAVMYLDFDRFKVINDSLGHKAGDMLLVTAAERLKRCLMRSDVLARWGGDEFAVLIRDVEEDHAVLDIANRLMSCFKSPIRLGDIEVTTSASIGIAFSSVGYSEPEEVLRDADTAMYRAKHLGKARYAIFDNALHEEVVEQLRLEGDLRRAIPQRELAVYYQPIYDLAHKTITGFEALVRWNSSQRGWVEPGIFIPLAEETGLIVEIGDWVLNQACRQLELWREHREPSDPLTIAVNVSGVQLARSDFVVNVAETLAQYGVNPEHLTLEFTESVLMEGDFVISSMRRLASLGVRLSIDDFGTGYSSLSYLHKMPIDILKIDREFVARLADGSDGESLVRSIVSMGKALRKTLVAEGIEDATQLNLLVAMGCDRGQGFLFSKAVPPDEARRLLCGDGSIRRPNPRLPELKVLHAVIAS